MRQYLIATVVTTEYDEQNGRENTKKRKAHEESADENMIETVSICKAAADGSPRFRFGTHIMKEETFSCQKFTSAKAANAGARACLDWLNTNTVTKANLEKSKKKLKTLCDAAQEEHKGFKPLS